MDILEKGLTSRSPAVAPNVTLLLLRLTNGIIFVAHGWQKLSDISPFVQGLSQLGIHPAGFWGPVAASCEFFGGVCLLIGFGSRLAAFSHSVIMIVAILTVHTPWRYGLTGGRGMEFPLTVFASSMVIMSFGAGNYSLSHLILNRRAPQPGSETLSLPNLSLKRISWLCAVTLVFVASHSMLVAVRSDSVPGQDVVDEVVAAERALWASFQRGDANGMFEMLDQNFTAFSGSMPDRMETRDAEREHLLKFLNELKGRLVEYRMINPRVQRFGDTAVLTYLFSTTVSVLGTTETRTGKQTSVWVKTRGEWRQVHYHYDYDH
jgi:putative oxidoreductase